MALTTINVKNKIPIIDSLRGLAALTVVICHSHIFPENNYLDLSRSAVLLFFIISGYCIALSLDTENKNSIFNFLARRFFRLYPVYWLSIALMVVASPETFKLNEIFINATMLQSFFNVANINNAYWTLFVELLFYILVIFFLYTQFNRTLNFYASSCIFFILISFLAACIRSNFDLQIPWAHLSFLSLFLFGSTIYAARNKNYSRISSYFYVAIYLCFTYWTLYFVYRDNHAYHFLGYALAIWIFPSAILTQWYRCRWLESLGKISYGIYLIHVPIMVILLKYINEGPIYLISLLFISIFFSYFTYLLIERPVIKFGKKLLAK